jgi:hypothetical protein
MAKVYHQQWREQHESSRYPFSDESSLYSTDGLDIGADTFLDASVYPIGGSEQMHISRVSVETFKITIYVGTVAQPELCSAEFDPLEPPSMLRLADVYGRSAGVLVSEAVRLARFQGWPIGEHLFDQAASELAASVCIPTPEIGVRGVITDAGDVITGDIWIVGENGVVVQEDTSEDLGPGVRVIRVDIVGEPLFIQALCGEVTIGDALEPAFQAVSYLQTINGVPPDEHGNFALTVGSNEASDPIIRITPSSNGVVIEAVGQATGGV